MKKILSLVIALSLFAGSYTVLADVQLKAKTKVIDHEDLTRKQHYIDLKESSVTDSRFITEEEKNLLARLVHAEAKGEPFEGKVAVAAVVLNRVEHKHFPDSIREVIYERNAFEPVSNGSINKPADGDAVQAVEKAVTDGEAYDQLLYFYNPDTATSDWIFTRDVVKKIGNHSFAI